jgi:hypothetical protein
MKLPILQIKTKEQVILEKEYIVKLKEQITNLKFENTNFKKKIAAKEKIIDDYLNKKFLLSVKQQANEFQLLIIDEINRIKHLMSLRFDNLENKKKPQFLNLNDEQLTLIAKKFKLEGNLHERLFAREVIKEIQLIKGN